MIYIYTYLVWHCLKGRQNPNTFLKKIMLFSFKTKKKVFKLKIIRTLVQLIKKNYIYITEMMPIRNIKIIIHLLNLHLYFGIFRISDTLLSS